MCNQDFTCLACNRLLYIYDTVAHYSSVLYFFMEAASLVLQMSAGSIESCTVVHNGSFSARLNVSLCWNFSFHSPPLCPYCDTVVLQISLFLKNKVKRISIKGGVFCVARRRVSPQVSTWSTQVFSYLICIHSHNEWTCLSCFQVRGVQTRLLFTLSSDTCVLLPLVKP